MALVIFMWRIKMSEVTGVKIVSHINDVKAELGNKLPAVLEALAIQAEGNAVDEITLLGAVDTGRLRGSISHAHDDEAAYIGTNVEYAPYVEYGTYKMQPRPFLRNGLMYHIDEYKEIVEKGLKS